MKNIFKKIKGLFGISNKPFTNEEIRNMSAEEYEMNRDEILSDVL